MAKNDYRRQLIMLRGLEKGYGGHARLEKRVMTGTMDFVATVPNGDEALEAAFIGVFGGKTTVTPLGQLKDDGRGQKALHSQFDPRNLSGLDLSQVSCAIISKDTGDGKEPVIYGCINGACTLDWQSIRRALNETRSPGAQEPSVSEPPSEEESAQPEPNEKPEDFIAQKVNAPETKTRAGEMLGIDLSKPWPEDIESLRILFMTLPVYEPFEKEGYVFIRAGMAEETGVDHCAVGVKAEDGQIKSVCYALPMPYTPEPPAGLEGYMWIGDDKSGWWVTCEDVNGKEA